MEGLKRGPTSSATVNNVSTESTEVKGFLREVETCLIAQVAREN